jgi:hypothetical protein
MSHNAYQTPVPDRLSLQNSAEQNLSLPWFINSEDFADCINDTPVVVSCGLPVEHKFVRFAGENRSDLKTMTDEDLVARATNPSYECSLRAYQRGYTFVGVDGKLGEYVGAIEAQVIRNRESDNNVSQETVIRTMEELTEPYTQSAIRERLFMRIREKSVREVDDRSFKQFTELLRAYNPVYNLFDKQIHASELAKMVFDYYNKTARQRRQAPIVQERLQAAFLAIAAENSNVTADKRAIVHHRFISEADKPHRLFGRFSTALTGKPPARTIDRLEDTYGEIFKSLGDEAPSVSAYLIPPNIGQQAVAATFAETAALARRAAEINPAMAVRRSAAGVAVVGITASGFLHPQFASAAEIPQISVSQLASVNSIVPAGVAVEMVSTGQGYAYGLEDERAIKAMVAEAGGDIVKQRIAVAMQFYMQKGETPMTAAAMVGNFMTESASTMDPKIHQLGGGPGRGIAQWTDTGRWAVLIDWAGKNNLDPNELMTQLEFSWHELSGHYKDTLHRAENAGTLREATLQIELGYEGPAKPSASIDARTRHAQRAYNLFKGHRQALGVTPPSAPSHINPPKAHTPASTAAQPKTIVFDLASVLSTVADVSPDQVTVPSANPNAQPTPVINTAAVQASLARLLAIPAIETVDASGQTPIDAVTPPINHDSQPATQIDVASLQNILAGSSEPSPADTNPQQSVGSPAPINPETPSGTVNPGVPPSSVNPTSPPTPDVVPPQSAPSPNSIDVGTILDGVLSPAGDTKTPDSSVITPPVTPTPPVQDAIVIPASLVPISLTPTVEVPTSIVDPTSPIQQQPIDQQPEQPSSVVVVPTPEAPPATAPTPEAPPATAPTPEAPPTAKKTDCAPDTQSVGIYKLGRSGKSELCAVGMRSTGEESTPGSKYYVEGANGRAIVRAADSLQIQRMINDAAKDGITLSAASSFRTFNHQKDLCNADAGCSHGNYMFVAPPGGSTHNLGQAIDYNIDGYSLDSGQCVTVANTCTAPDSKVYQWLSQNAANYNEHQYSKESWHWDSSTVR